MSTSASASASFPAPTIPCPSDSSDDDTRHPHPPDHRSARSHRPPPLSFRKPPPRINKVLPPTPSPLSSVSAAQHTRRQSRNARSRRRTAAVAPGLLRASDSEADADEDVLEMDSYPRADDEETGLTAADRRRMRRQARRGSVGLHAGDGGYDDELLVADGGRVASSKEEKKLADLQVVRSLAVNLLLIGLWYLFSVLISIYNKWMFSPDRLNFHFPLFVTCTHMIVQFCLSSLVLFALPQFRPAGFFGAKIPESAMPPAGNDGPGGDDRGGFFRFNNRAEERRRKQLGIMTKWVYLTKIGPCGAATGLDIGLGNMSMKFITLTFYTMCKSSSLAFVLLFAFIFRLEKVTWKLAGIIAVMTLGVVMMVAGETHFILTGFMLVITASALSGLRWSLTQMLLLKNPATSNPFSSIFFLAPCMFVAIFVIAVPVEGFGALVAGFADLVARQGLLPAVGIVLFPGIIAFLMVSSEFALLRRSSVVTLSIAGIFKELVTISASAVFFDDRLTPINISGLLVTIISIAAYNYIKIQKMRREAAAAQHSKALGLTTDDDDEDVDVEYEYVTDSDGDGEDADADADARGRDGGYDVAAELRASQRNDDEVARTDIASNDRAPAGRKSTNNNTGGKNNNTNGKPEYHQHEVDGEQDQLVAEVAEEEEEGEAAGTETTRRSGEVRFGESAISPGVRPSPHPRSSASTSALEQGGTRRSVEGERAKAETVARDHHQSLL